ncbi:MAG: site-specific integrase, partial [Oscillospiraceae bacterium]|nr:site-specific integrase [Oscillospiraceae bacterium]
RRRMTRKNDGRWQAVVTVDGKRLYFCGKTKAEVNKKMLAWKEEREQGIPFARVADEWWEETSSRLSPNSCKNYGAAYKRAKSAFELIPIRSITPAQISAQVSAFALTHAEKTVKTQLGVINLIFKFAVAHGYTETNAARDVPLPGGLKKTKRHGASSEDIARIKDSVHLPFGLFAFMALYTGLRLGELLALQWSDIDIAARTISVTKSVYWANAKAHIKQPKTETSVGVVPIVDALLLVLPKGKKSGLVFPNANGELITAADWKRMWNAYKKQSGVTSTPHQFRHSFATMLFESNVPPQDAQALLRHAHIGTTMDVYTELRAEKLKQIHSSVYSVNIS